MDEMLAKRFLDDVELKGYQSRDEAKRIITAFGTSAVDQIVRQMQGKDFRRRRTAAIVLGLMGSDATKAIPALQEAAMQRFDGILQQQAKVALTNIRNS